MVRTPRYLFTSPIQTHFDSVFIEHCSVLGSSDIAGPLVGWWLIGLEAFSFHVYLPLWIKLLIFTIVLRVRVGLVLAPVNLVRKNHITQGLHQIWFLPLTLSPFFTSITLQGSSNINKLRDKRWTETFIWKSMINAILPIYNIFIFQQLILSGMIVILFLALVN